MGFAEIETFPFPTFVVALLSLVSFCPSNGDSDFIKWALMFSRLVVVTSMTHQLVLRIGNYLCRDYPNRYPQVRAFFDKAFLYVTLQMRAEVMSWPKQHELNRPASNRVTEPGCFPLWKCPHKWP